MILEQCRLQLQERVLFRIILKCFNICGLNSQHEHNWLTVLTKLAAPHKNQWRLNWIIASGGKQQIPNHFLCHGPV